MVIKCVYTYRAVVVVNRDQLQAELHFTYTGPSYSKGLCILYGIASNSDRISSNPNNLILNQGGQLIRFIDISFFHRPSGLYENTRNNLFVAETVHVTGKIKEIQLQYEMKTKLCIICIQNICICT